MKRSLLLILLISFGRFVDAQQWSPGDSIRLSLKNKPQFTAGLDSRSSYLLGKPIHIFGLRVGADYKKNGRICWILFHGFSGSHR